MLWDENISVLRFGGQVWILRRYGTNWNEHRHSLYPTLNKKKNSSNASTKVLLLHSLRSTASLHIEATSCIASYRKGHYNEKQSTFWRNDQTYLNPLIHSPTLIRWLVALFQIGGAVLSTSTSQTVFLVGLVRFYFKLKDDRNVLTSSANMHSSITSPVNGQDHISWLMIFRWHLRPHRCTLACVAQ